MNIELLNHALRQYQYLKGYDPTNPNESYDKVRNSFMSVFKKIIETYMQENVSERAEKPLQSLKTSPVDNSEPPKKKNAPDELEIGTFKKAGHKDSQRLKNWRKWRDTKVIELYKECKCKKQPIDDEIIFRIAQIAGSTSPKVKRIINEYEFSKI